MSLVLHHLNASRSQRIIWLMEELGLPYTLVRHERDAQTRLAPPELLKVHPMGKAPLLEHEGQVIAETGAIAQYILALFDTEHRLHPKPGTPEFARYLEWMHAAEGSPFLPGLILVFTRATGLQDSLLAGWMTGERDKATATIESHLARHTWFAGDMFTAADCLMGFQLDGMEKSGLLDNAPATKDWLKRAHAREAYKRMIAQGV